MQLVVTLGVICVCKLPKTCLSLVLGICAIDGALELQSN